MNIQDKMNKIKNELTKLINLSKHILAAKETIGVRQQYMDIIESYRIFDSDWDLLGRLRRAMEEIYNKHEPTFILPKFRFDAYDSDCFYTQEHGYLLIKIDTSREDLIELVGFAPLVDSYKENTKKHTLESTYAFVMDCIKYISEAARRMLCLPIFNPNELVFLSLVCHYYFDYGFDAQSDLMYIQSIAENIPDDFKRMVFETNGAHPLSVRGNLPILSHYAQKKGRGDYRWYNNAPVSFVKNMKSNKALNLRKAFSNMENLLTIKHGSSYEEIGEKIAFVCTVGFRTREPHYDRRKRFPGVSTKPATTFVGNLSLGILSTCMAPDRTSFDKPYVGWIGFRSNVSIYGRYENIFNYLEDDIVNTLEDNYNFLVEKLPGLNEKALRNAMLDYIITEGR